MVQFSRYADATLERHRRLPSTGVEPNHRLSYSWNASGEEAAGGLKTVVTWTLTPTKGGGLVRMEQSGFRPEDEANCQGASYGWQRYIGGGSGWPRGRAENEADHPAIIRCS